MSPLLTGAASPSPLDPARRRRDGDELAAQQRQYAALDASIEPGEFRAPT